MDKAINGDGWAFTPAADGKPAMWSGNDSILNMRAPAADHINRAAAPFIIIGWCLALLILPLAGEISLLIIENNVVYWVCGLGAAGFVVFQFTKAGLSLKNQPLWLGSEWQLAASGNGLTFRGGDSWSVALDDVTRVETGATVEWIKMRPYPKTKIARKAKDALAIPKAEMQVFIFCNDGRRLVVHTANAAREDCGMLAHSIRSYVETQRGNAAPSPSSSDTSSPAADGFDL